ncbi:hypothetical protein A3A71_03690 [Candidatus Berkelbacteria bacterium RIFCSPLOWO2_01_FULL_50_28]|uniref:Restriction endonuclease type IV Mrr domain-containing protein n=1 Tax=Candidatus Berkelbacteria bacterium RIFCSPLOWO2_01_FULL_50_28 TaxID=1797471 RepID=A0A1F5EA30_9BACT|nr:MAG: hypothetical protein A3F39_01055 [Candidatus Berkelbacteria bacterium RIFCSPHIGHO2_12_FULL_50_11]OGD64252.1 MAG: hypothetical protein A3A71_03690 [Candidatus Berkelbacteria bacterium RIFCSPLOWO2_01_FULL_50_28]
MTETEVQKCVVAYLAAKGWSRNIKTKGLNEHGCDIVLRHSKYARYFFIECKGEPRESTKSKSSSREVSFIYSLGQIITRIQNPKAGYYYGLALPELIANLALRRVSSYVRKHLKLHIFSIANNGVVTEYKPGKTTK